MNNPDKPIRLLESVPSEAYDRLVVRYPYQTDREYAAAYHFSAQRLAGTFTGNPIDDLILLPFLSLYRQAFELQLKNTIRSLVRTRIVYVEGRTSVLIEAASDERLKNDFVHNLYKLLNEAKKHYAALQMDEPFPRHVERLVIMLHDADKNGTSFRYSGQFPETQEHADFPNLAELLDEQFNMLSVVTDYVEGSFDAMPTLQELESEMY